MNKRQLEEHRVRGEFKNCYDEAIKLLSTIKPETEYGRDMVIDRISELIKDMEDSYYLLLGHFEQRVIAMRKEIEQLNFANTAQCNTIQSLVHELGADSEGQSYKGTTVWGYKHNVLDRLAALVNEMPDPNGEPIVSLYDVIEIVKNPTLFKDEKHK